MDIVFDFYVLLKEMYVKKGPAKMNYTFKHAKRSQWYFLSWQTYIILYYIILYYINIMQLLLNGHLWTDTSFLST